MTIPVACGVPRLIVEVERLGAKCERMYRKGWRHIIDGETPPIPDLIFPSA